MKITIHLKIIKNDSRTISKQLELKAAHEKAKEDYFVFAANFVFWVLIDLTWVNYSKPFGKQLGNQKII